MKAALQNYQDRMRRVLDHIDRHLDDDLGIERLLHEFQQLGHAFDGQVRRDGVVTVWNRLHVCHGELLSLLVCDAPANVIPARFGSSHHQNSPGKRVTAGLLS